MKISAHPLMVAVAMGLMGPSALAEETPTESVSTSEMALLQDLREDDEDDEDEPNLDG